MTPDAALPAEEASSSPHTTPLRPRGSNQVGMRQFNERVVLQALRLHGALPKADLARLTGLTAQTIGLITARLDEDGLILKQDRVRGRIGQPSVPLSLNPDGAYAIASRSAGAAPTACWSTSPAPYASAWASATRSRTRTACCRRWGATWASCAKAWARWGPAWWA